MFSLDFWIHNWGLGFSILIHEKGVDEGEFITGFDYEVKLFGHRWVTQ